MTHDPRSMAADVAQQIRLHPESHDQRVWRRFDPWESAQLTNVPVDRLDGSSGTYPISTRSCNTTACVAGWASTLAGDRGDYLGDRAVTADGRVLTYRHRGEELLGVSVDDSEWLFAPFRTKGEVLYALDELAAGKRISRRYTYQMTHHDVQELLKPRPSATPRKPRVVHVTHEESKAEQKERISGTVHR